MLCINRMKTRDLNAEMNNDLKIMLAEIDFLKTELDLQSLLLNDKLLQDLDVNYTFESNRIEGSRLTLPETELAIKIGLTITGKSMAEYLAAINHYQAVQFVREQADDQVIITEALIKQVHSILLRGINKENAGVYRTRPLTDFSGYMAPPPEQIPELMAETVEWLRLEGEFIHPVMFSAETHQRLLALQPFSDANGACARLLMNLVLLRAGYPLANFGGNNTRHQAYYNALKLAHDHNFKTAWLKLMAEQVMSDIKNLLARIQEQQIHH